MRSMEVEGVEKVGNIPDGIVVGKILEIKKHPNADKLQLVHVAVGAIHESPLRVVCGAWNIKVGDNVPVATVGTKLSNGMEIREAEIRGEKSFGMLLAADELGIGDDHSGIIILTKKAKVGELALKYLGASDTIIEIKVLPDRAHDCLSHVGVAREIAVLENQKLGYDFDGLKLPKTKKRRPGVETHGNASLQVNIQDKKLCPRYIGAVMTEVEIKPSPKWMRDRLNACGIKAINNVVDATNYIMLELGQPLHAFDAEKISDNNKKTHITVRKARKKEKMILLDGSEMELSENDLLITNGEKPLALAGIMGGLDSGISEKTKTIILEAASFDATSIRRTRTRLGFKTESSDRFEKDLDPNLAEKAMVRVIEILEHTASAKLEGIVDQYPKLVKSWKVKLDLEYVNDLLGEKIPTKEIIKILNSLSIDTKHQKQNVKYLDCAIPTFRLDVRTQEDLIEEIGRVWGYENIKTEPLMEPVEPAKINEQVFFERKVKNILTGLGCDEVYNYSFYSRQDAAVCGLDSVKHYELANPMSPEQELIRVSLLPNVLKNVRENLKHFEGFNIFEIGRVYYPNNNKVEEKRMLVLVKVLSDDKKAEAFYNVKGFLENLLESLNLKGEFFESKEDIKLVHPSRSAEIRINGENVGVIAEVNPQVLAQYKIKKCVAMVEVDLENLRKVVPKIKTYSPISKFPTVTRDISLLSPKNVTVAEITSSIKKSGKELAQSVELFDIFYKDNENNYAFHIIFGSPERTLESVEVDEIMEKIILTLEKELKTETRK